MLKTLSAVLLGAALSFAPAVTAQEAPQSPPGTDTLRADIQAHYDAKLEDLFIHFHRNPELSFREFDTAKRLARELRALGIEVTEGVGGTGIVGVVNNGEGPTVMLRADMDGLPIEEQSGLPYASQAEQRSIDGQVKPVMHACGHDAHMATLVGAAKQLMDRRDLWSGTLVLIGQPAEERISGAKAMLDDGLYERFPKPDMAFAYHVASQIEAGKIRIEPRMAFSSSDSVDITVHGVGTHGASPHQGKDPVLMGSQIVTALQTLVSRTIPPLEAGVVTVGSFHAGTKHNIISDKAELQLTVRANSGEVRQDLLDGIARIAEQVGRMNNLPEDKLPEVTRLPERTPPTYNDPELAAHLTALFENHFGAETMHKKPRQGMGAEDFAYFVDKGMGVKGVYFRVGGTPAEELDEAPPHHSPFFKIAPEPSIITSTEAFVVTVLDVMGKDGGQG
jgi:hippurate hydrolase